ncbi:MAG: hypothetical protein AAFP97_04310 [Pseudomonadota bacterium]
MDFNQLTVSLSKPILGVCVTGLVASQALAQAAGNYAPDGYRIETIVTPEGVPFEIAGLAVCSDKLYASIRMGDIWALQNGSQDAAIQSPQWSKFADGLDEPAGLSCGAEGSLLVAHKPELTQLIDRDGDGVADEYINLADSWDFHDNYHEYHFGTAKDLQGNLYGTLNLSHDKPGSFSLGAMGSTGGYRGWAYQVSPQGDFKPFASGLRSPAGIGASPSGEIFYTDNQGDWVGTSKLHLLEEGKFYGHPVSLRDHPDYTVEAIKEMSLDELYALSEKPVVWFPHVEVSNSPGNPEWDITGGKFGPFEGQIFIGDQTQSNVFRVMLDEVDGQYQGAVLNFIGGFQSGNIRTVFDQYGHLWVGQTTAGWAAEGPEPFGLQRVVWDGETVPFELLDMSLTKQGFLLNFTEPLDPTTIGSSSVSAQQWHYKYSSNYGSPKEDLRNLEIQDTRLSQDGKILEVILDLERDKVVSLDFSQIESLSGRSVSVGKVYYTVNVLKN